MKAGILILPFLWKYEIKKTKTMADKTVQGNKFPFKESTGKDQKHGKINTK